MRKFRVFVAAISDLVCLCLGQAGRFFKRSAESCAIFRVVKIPRFRCGYFRLMCARVLRRDRTCENSAFLLQLFPAYVRACAATRQESCENSMLLLRLFPAYVCCDATGVV